MEKFEAQQLQVLSTPLHSLHPSFHCVCSTLTNEILKNDLSFNFKNVQMEKAGKRCTVKFKFKFIFIFLLIEVEFALMPIHSYWKYENAEKLNH